MVIRDEAPENVPLAMAVMMLCDASLKYKKSRETELEHEKSMR